MHIGHLTDAADDRPSTSSASERDRGQTVQDFAVGIGIFLLAIAFVFSFVPSIITPFEDAGGAETAQADRIAATIVENASTETTNELDWAALSTYDGSDSEELADELGLKKTGSTAITHVNITLIEIEDVAADDPKLVLAGGDDYDDQIGSSASRIVTTDDQSQCETACKLVVRVW
ncbi:hypothetical protein C479_02091 [Halovivax asiaticus JCM 14624]|uniref:Uncharacterized protein n=1 Tax=Halovivax asiaticus JCM 14624 TaxID=1227490 RepID=M0BU12_9EURY|nr:hypothetical protein [Halovivax asiaticus]ELZ13597.1 hypothetical protein C479_02091 [Halovivax asiaticus JCM 14624]